MLANHRRRRAFPRSARRRLASAAASAGRDGPSRPRRPRRAPPSRTRRRPSTRRRSPHHRHGPQTVVVPTGLGRASLRQVPGRDESVRRLCVSRNYFLYTPLLLGGDGRWRSDPSNASGGHRGEGLQVLRATASTSIRREEDRALRGGPFVRSAEAPTQCPWPRSTSSTTTSLPRWARCPPVRRAGRRGACHVLHGPRLEVPPRGERVVHADAPTSWSGSRSCSRGIGRRAYGRRARGGRRHGVRGRGEDVPRFFARQDLHRPAGEDPERVRPPPPSTPPTFSSANIECLLNKQVQEVRKDHAGDEGLRDRRVKSRGSACEAPRPSPPSVREDHGQAPAGSRRTG